MTKVKVEPKKSAAIEDAQIVDVTALAVVRENAEQTSSEASARVEELKAKTQKPTVSLGERLDKLGELNRLATIHGKLTAKRGELVDVTDANIRGNALLVVTADGVDVEVKHPDVIAEALALMMGKIDTMAADIAAQIVDLNI